MTDYGIKCSKQGEGVVGADNESLVFSSGARSLKVAQTGTGTFDSGGVQTEDVSHSLGITTTYLVYDTSSWKSGAWQINPFSHTESSKIVIKNDADCDWRYYIFSEEAIGVTEGAEEGAGDMGVKVSRDGRGVVGATTPQSLVLTSAKQSPLLLETVTVEVDITGAGYFENSESHSLGFAPAHVAICVGNYVLDDDGGDAHATKVMPQGRDALPLGHAEVCVTDSLVWLRAKYVDGITYTATVYLWNLPLE